MTCHYKQIRIQTEICLTQTQGQKKAETHLVRATSHSGQAAKGQQHEQSRLVAVISSLTAPHPTLPAPSWGNGDPKPTKGLEMPNSKQISSPLAVLPQGKT